MCATTELGEEVLPASPHSGCLLCGSANPCSLRLSFQDTAGGAVCAAFQTSRVLQGYPGILHGGVAPALLDAAMTNCLFHHDIQALTGDLHLRYLHPIPCPAQLEVRAWIVAKYSPLYHLRGEISLMGQVMTRAEGKFVRRKGDQGCPGN